MNAIAARHLLYSLRKDLNKHWLNPETRRWLEEKIRYYEASLDEYDSSRLDRAS